MKIRRSYSIDEEIYKKFLEYVKKNSINISKFIENAMITKLNEDNQEKK